MDDARAANEGALWPGRAESEHDAVDKTERGGSNVSTCRIGAGATTPTRRSPTCQRAKRLKPDLAWRKWANEHWHAMACIGVHWQVITD